jgi:hypothetical protein
MGGRMNAALDRLTWDLEQYRVRYAELSGQSVEEVGEHWFMSSFEKRFNARRRGE